MTDAATKEADLASIKTRYELAFAIANQPKIASNPVVIAALAHAKATYAAFLAALAEADAAHGFRILSTYRHVHQTGNAADSAFAALGAAIVSAPWCLKGAVEIKTFGEIPSDLAMLI